MKFPPMTEPPRRVRQGRGTHHHRDGYLYLLRRLPTEAIGQTTRDYRQLGIGTRIWVPC